MIVFYLQYFILLHFRLSRIHKFAIYVSVSSLQLLRKPKFTCEGIYSTNIYLSHLIDYVKEFTVSEYVLEYYLY
jgi:hypothetical protein